MSFLQVACFVLVIAILWYVTVAPKMDIPRIAEDVTRITPTVHDSPEISIPSEASIPSVCFVRSAYGMTASNFSSGIEDIPDSHRVKNHYHILFTNLGDLRPLGWIPIVTSQPYRRFATHEAYAKFMSWKDPVVYHVCDVVFYSTPPASYKSTSWDTSANELLQTESGLMQNSMGGGVFEYLDRIVSQSSDYATMVGEVKKWMMSDNAVNENIRLWNTDSLGYVPKAAAYQELSESFWKHYSLEDDLWMHAPIWSYFVDRKGSEPIQFPKTDVTMSRTDSIPKFNGETDSDAQAFYSHQAESTPQKCFSRSSVQMQKLAQEISDYESMQKFQDKIDEVNGTAAMALHHVAIRDYLYSKILVPGWSVLELGCAAGMMLKTAREWYTKNGHSHGAFVGLELVTGWVNFARDYFNPTEISIHEGDMTDFELPQPYSNMTFDFVMLNDVMEHIDKGRYGCMFQSLKRVTHPGSVVYMHTPSPEAQLEDDDQFIENVLPHHVVVSGMRHAGFELVVFEHDLDTRCGGDLMPSTPRILSHSQCNFGMWPKYTHSVFYRPKDSRVFQLS